MSIIFSYYLLVFMFNFPGKHLKTNNNYIIDVLIVIILSRMLTKRAQGRKKFGRKNFKQRYFKLTTRDLSYAKQKGKYYYLKYINKIFYYFNNYCLILSKVKSPFAQ